MTSLLVVDLIVSYYAQRFNVFHHALIYRNWNHRRDCPLDVATANISASIVFVTVALQMECLAVDFGIIDYFGKDGTAVIHSACLVAVVKFDFYDLSLHFDYLLFFIFENTHWKDDINDKSSEPLSEF